MTKWCSFSHVKLKTLPEPQQSELLIKRSIGVARKKGVTFLFYNSIPKL